MPYIAFFLGAVFAVVGIILFIKKYGEPGVNIIRLFGFGFRLSNSSLVIFVLGVVVLLIAGGQINQDSRSDGNRNSGNSGPTHAGDSREDPIIKSVRDNLYELKNTDQIKNEDKLIDTLRPLSDRPEFKFRARTDWRQVLYVWVCTSSLSQ